MKKFNQLFWKGKVKSQCDATVHATLQIPDFGEDVEQHEYPCSVERSTRWYNRYGEKILPSVAKLDIAFLWASSSSLKYLLKISENTY